MAACQFTGKIDHTEKSIQALFRAEYHAYEMPRILIRMGIGVALVFAAVFLTLPTWARAVLMLFGAWFLVSGDFPSQIRADKAVEARHGVLPGMRYEFFDDRVKLTGEGSMTIPYKKYARLTQDREYLYLFLSKDSVCMLERATLKPAKPEAFMKFIEEQTGLAWRREFSLLTLNLTDLLQISGDRHRK